MFETRPTLILLVLILPHRHLAQDRFLLSLLLLGFPLAEHFDHHGAVFSVVDEIPFGRHRFHLFRIFIVAPEHKIIQHPLKVLKARIGNFGVNL